MFLCCILQSRGIGNHKKFNFVDATILEITQDALHIDQIHRLTVFLLNIYQFKLRKRLKNTIILFPSGPNH